MQPYFFPYIGHFSLIALVDKWIVFDISQYTPKTWMNRNRILHPKIGWQYVTIPLQNSSRSIKTKEAKILDLKKSHQSILGKLSHYKRKAPYFHEVDRIIKKTFTNVSDNYLVSLNVSALKSVCDYLNIPFEYQIASELAIDYPSNLSAGDWAPYICENLEATEYVNPTSGKELFDSIEFQKRGISLLFLKFAQYEYSTGPYAFEPNLSILDVMMWNKPKDIKIALQYRVSLHKTV
jgi:hypothetical protein